MTVDNRGSKISEFYSKIAGVKFYNEGDNTEHRQKIIRELLRKGMLEPDQILTLQLDPHNPYDPNAVKVLGPDGRQLGFLSKEVASNIATRIREGYICSASVSAVTGGTAEYLYGVNVKIEVYEAKNQNSTPSLEHYPTLKTDVSADTSLHKPLVFPLLVETDSKFFLTKPDLLGQGYCITKYLDREQGLSNIVIPAQINRKQVTTIGRESFCECVDLVSISIPNGVLVIEEDAFYDCTSLTHISIPESVRDIGENVFHRCFGLTDINLPKGIRKISAFLFSGCICLSNIIIPSSVQVIGRCAFSGCEGLTRIIIPENTKKIDEAAFRSCCSLIDIVIPESVTEIGESAFENCIHVTINAPSGSYAEQYAKERKIPFCAI